MNAKLLHRLIIGIFVSLYLITSTISTIHSIDFFQIANSYLMSIFLAIAFEIGAGASLVALVIKDKMNMFLVWSIFIVLTLFQIMNNVYFSFMHLGDFSKWSELFGLNEEDVIMQKRIVSIVLGAVLPLIALGFIKALVDYINPKEEVLKTLDEPIKKEIETTERTTENAVEESYVAPDTFTSVNDNVDNLTSVNNVVKEVENTEAEDANKMKIDEILNDDIGTKLATVRRGGM